MLENTIENKKRFFGAYIMQKVLVSPSKFGMREILGGIDITYLKENDYLQLRPLSAITDEDAIDVAKHFDPSDGWYIEDRNDICIQMKQDHFSLCIWFTQEDFIGVETITEVDCFTEDLGYAAVSITDFLRSRGYLLPFKGLSVEKIVEYGWVKVK